MTVNGRLLLPDDDELVSSRPARSLKSEGQNRRTTVRRIFIALLTSFVSMLAIAGGAEAPSGPGAAPQKPDATPDRSDPGSASTTGTVTETMDASQYTYVEVDIGDQRIWAAGPRTQVTVGDTVFLPPGVLMVDFFSNRLDRKFDRIYLVHTMRVESGGQASSASPADDQGGQAELQVAFDVSGIERVEGGHTVGEIFERKASLAGQAVAVRGKVVKTNSGVLGWNWIHLQDGTAGPEGAKELVVTTHGIAEVGSTVVVRGTVATEKDFGYGYKYDVLVEDASVGVE